MPQVFRQLKVNIQFVSLFMQDQLYEQEILLKKIFWFPILFISIQKTFRFIFYTIERKHPKRHIHILFGQYYMSRYLLWVLTVLHEYLLTESWEDNINFWNDYDYLLGTYLFAGCTLTIDYRAIFLHFLFSSRQSRHTWFLKDSDGLLRRWCEEKEENMGSWPDLWNQSDYACPAYSYRYL